MKALLWFSQSSNCGPYLVSKRARESLADCLYFNEHLVFQRCGEEECERLSSCSCCVSVQRRAAKLSMNYLVIY